MNSLLPVVLFTYNRPDHTRRTINALANNALARDVDLIIYSDAPKSEADRAAVEEVRSLIGTVTGFRLVTVVFREKNLGLAESIISGVGHAVEKYGRVIVLEDDIVTSPFFLNFMRDALDLYEDDERVMHISACRYPVRVPRGEGDTFFLRVPLCWGWATWGRAWNKFHRDTRVFETFGLPERSAFDFGDTHSYWKQAEGNMSGRMKTWFVFWYACLFRSHGLALFPREALARNIGHDGTGVHCGSSQKFDVELFTDRMTVTPRPVVESHAIVKAHRRYFRYIKAPTWRRALWRRLGIAPLG